MVAWDTLTLEDLLRLTVADNLTGRGDACQFSLTAEWSSDPTVSPPKATPQDTLCAYIALRWCPWFSRMFGVLSEENLNLLTVKLLAGTRTSAPVVSELLVTVLLMLTVPNVPCLPIIDDPSRARTFLFSDRRHQGGSGRGERNLDDDDDDDDDS